MQIKQINVKTQNKVSAEQSADLIKKLRKEHDKPCKGMFEFLDAQGGWLEFPYRFFKGEPLTLIRLVHGEICELPMGLVKHLNNTKKKIRKMSAIMDESGRVPQDYEVVSRVRFTPVDVL